MKKNITTQKNKRWSETTKKKKLNFTGRKTNLDKIK